MVRLASYIEAHKKEEALLLDDLPGHVYEQFASVGRALSDPTRLKILNLLCQTERSVDDLAEKLGHSKANTSAHLKVLTQASLVGRRKQGRHVFYSLAGEPSLRLWLALRDMGLQELPAVRDAMRAFAADGEELAMLEGEELLSSVEAGEVLLLDLRPLEEFEAGHLPHARSIPANELSVRMTELDPNTKIIAYCRGPYCVAAIKSVRKMRAAGLNATRLSGGVAEWRAAGRRLAPGNQTEDRVEMNI